MKKTKSLIILLVLFLICGCENQVENKISFEPLTYVVKNYSYNIPNESIYSPDYLVLVNRNNIFDEKYLENIELVSTYTFDGTLIYLELETYNAYLELHDYLLSQGIEIGIREGYRSLQGQQEIWDYFLTKYSLEYTGSITAPVGYSEHHTGLALDINPKIDGTFFPEGESKLKSNAIYDIIHEALKDYGFILRYPKGKEAITGYPYEAWHIRYVGKKVAQEIYLNDWTLEEYLYVHNN